MNKRELQQKLAALVSEERSQLERLEKEGRALIGDDKEAYERRAADIAAIEEKIQGFETLEAKVKENREREERLSEFRSTPERPTASAKPGSPDEEMQRRALARALRVGTRSLNEEEKRALQVGDDPQGGYLQAPQMMVQGILKGVDNAVVIRQLATKFQVGGAESLGQISLDTDLDDFEWTSELATGSEDTATRFGKRELRPHPLAKRLKVSRKLISSSVVDIVAYLQGRIAYKQAVTQEKAFMTGTGVQRPLGVFTASDNGIPTSRDVSTGNTTTSIGADGLIEAKHALKSNYWTRNLRWIFHRDAIKQIRKLKLGDGQYIWQAGLSDDLPARILEVPYLISEYAPNTFTTGLYVGIIGDFSYYYIADSMDMQIQVLNELYAETNQVGYIARSETDGMPVLAEAFARVKLA